MKHDSTDMLQLSPSNIAGYFFLDCERMLCYSSIPKDRAKEEGIPEIKTPDQVSQFMIEKGRDWEEKVCRRLGDRVIIGPETGNRLCQRVLSYEQTIDILRQNREESYLYQCNLQAPDNFYQRFSIDREKISFGNCRPDFVHLLPKNGQIQLKIIDVKSSDSARFRHWVQIAIYAFLLRDILEYEQIEHCHAETHFCEMWFMERSQPERQNLSSIIEPLQHFLAEKLPTIILQPPHEAHWSLGKKCEWCPYLNHCSEQARKDQDISLVPLLSSRDRRFFKTLEQPVDSLVQLDDWLEDEQNQTLYQNYPSVYNKREHILAQAKALANGIRQHICETSIALPKTQDIAVVISLHKDPVAGGIFAAGIHGEGEIEGLKSWANVACDWNDCDYIAAEFFTVLEHTAQIVHDYNQNCRPHKRKSLQFYLYDNYERELLDELLLSTLKDPEIACRLLSIFYFFCDSDDYTIEISGTYPFPIVVIEEALRRNTALPVPVAYALYPVHQSIKGSDSMVYSELCSPISGQLRYNSQIETQILETEILRRMKTSLEIVETLQRNLSSQLLAYPPAFLLPEEYRYKNPLLAKLSFSVRYEEILNYLNIRKIRSASRKENIESNKAFSVRFLQQQSGNRWTIALASESSNARPIVSNYPDWILVCDDKSGYDNQMLFPDIWHSRQSWVSDHCAVSYCAIEKKIGERWQVKLTQGIGSPRLREGDQGLLLKRYSNFTSERLLQNLQKIDNHRNSYFLSLIRDPHRSLQNYPEILPSSFRRQFPFTDSQYNAFVRIFQYSHQLIWGPPGTGKTYFLALSICALAKTAKRKLKILVTAFTHSAIENCLRTLSEMRTNYGEIDMAITKLGDWRGEHCPDDIEEKIDYCPLPFVHQVVGGTVYSIARLPGTREFDMVIIDEGSQMKVSEAAIAIETKKRDGRLIIAGDDCQLGPIINGKYPEPRSSTPFVFGSIFQCLSLQDPDRHYTSQLQECFRMNEVLCRFPAQNLYGEQYRPANEQISRQSLQMQNQAPKKNKVRILSKVQILGDPVEKAENWLEWALTAKHPLVLLSVTGTNATNENLPEATIVAKMAAALRRRLCYRDDFEFRKKGLFIVSPHHRQIQLIHQQLELYYPWQTLPLVDTVEKMQGRESEAVIISYGVSDIEQALREGEFLYSLNRLNVALTRAKSKTIVCIPDAIFSPPLNAFGEKELIIGLDYMLKLRKFMQQGEKQLFHFSPQIDIHGRRLS